MKIFLAIITVALACSAPAQLAPSRILRPLTKQTPAIQNPPPKPSPPVQIIQPRQDSKPLEIVAKIEKGLAVSKIKLLGREDGLAGIMFITNISQQPMTPVAQFAVCDRSGAQIGSASNGCKELLPAGVGRIEVLSSNQNAGEFKLLKLSAASKEK